MGTYGRNFDFLIPPENEHRHGRFVVPGTGDRIPMGAPILVDTTKVADGLGLQPVKLAVNAATPIGERGILVYEFAPAAFAGDDPFLTTYSDKDTAPLGAAVQMVDGQNEVKVRFTNTLARTFLNTRQYAARTMVAGIAGATPTVKVGDFLTPGIGTDVAGYWTETADVTKAWLVVTAVDTSRGEVDALMLV